MKGKVGIVTGAASGIGLAIAEGLAKEGVTVVMADINEAALKEQAERIGCDYKVADLSKRESCKELADYAIEKHGGVGTVVQDVHLHLGHLPLIPVVEDVHEAIIVIVEGEAGVANLALGKGLREELLVIQFLHLLETVLVHRVKDVEVHMVGLKLFQLLVQELHHILIAADIPAGQLGGQDDLLAVAVLQSLANHDLALTAVVGVSSVDIGHAAVDGVANHADGLRLVDLSVRFAGKTHAAKAQHAALTVDGREFRLEHIVSPLLIDAGSYQPACRK